MKPLEDLSEAELLAVGRIAQATEQADKARNWLEATREVRNAGIIELRQLGWGVREIAVVAGLSVGQVSKIGGTE